MLFLKSFKVLLLGDSLASFFPTSHLSPFWWCCSVTQSCLTLWHHGLQYPRLPCPSPSPGACSSSCPLSWWYHPTISSSVTPFSSFPQSFPASGSSSKSWLFASGGQIIGASASAPVLPMNIQDWFPLGLTNLIFLKSPMPQFKSINSSALSLKN